MTDTKQPQTPDSVIGKNGEEMSNNTDNDKLIAVFSVLFPIVGLIVYLVKNDSSDYLKNYTRQGATMFLVCMVSLMAAIIPFIGWIYIFCLFLPFMLITSVVLMVKAAQGEKTYKLPVIGDIANSLFK